MCVFTLRRGSAVDRLLGFRVRIPPEAWMFALCVLYSKGQKENQDNHDKEVQTKYREQKEIPPGSWMFVL
jgi:hypothetical protein